MREGLFLCFRDGVMGLVMVSIGGVVRMAGYDGM